MSTLLADPVRKSTEGPKFFWFRASRPTGRVVQMVRRAYMLALLAAPLALAGCPDWNMYLPAQCSDPVGVRDNPSQLPRACPVEDAGADGDAAADAAEDEPDAEDDGPDAEDDGG
jgi:hypothetical protein